MQGTVHRYNERGTGGFANVGFASGERILVSLAASGLRVHRLILAGRVPWGTLYVADAALLGRIGRVLAADLHRLPPLPDNAAMDALLTGAIKVLGDPDVLSKGPAENSLPVSTLQLLTRASLAEPDAAAFVRRLQRAAATPFPGR